MLLQQQPKKAYASIKRNSGLQLTLLLSLTQDIVDWLIFALKNGKCGCFPKCCAVGYFLFRFYSVWKATSEGYAIASICQACYCMCEVLIGIF